MEEKSLHRDWVKNAAIIFLSVLLVLTFFSNTIMNRTLPEAAAKQVTSGSIVAQVRVSGTVSADGSYEVKADRSREIRSVMVRTGDKVETGDVLFVLGEGDSEELEAAQDNLRALQLSYQRAAIGMQNYDYTREEEAVEAASKELEAANQELKRIENLIRSELDPALLARVDLANSNVEQAQKELNSCLEARTGTINEKKQIMDTADEDRKIKEAALKEFEEGTEEYNAAYGEYRYADEKYNEAKNDYYSYINTEDEKLVAAQKELEQKTSEYNALLDQTNLYPAEKAAAAARVADAQEKFNTLDDALKEKQEQNRKAQALAGLELSELAQQIEKAKAKVSELSGGEENEVKANVSGTVQSIAITAGSMATKGTVLCTIEVPDLGYSLTATVTAEQARRLHIGDTATIQNYYWGSQIVATLKTIQNDPKNPQNSRILTFALDGDVTAGSELKLSVGSRSANYDTILPNSAIRTDSNGTFVLVIQEKSSPLGNRYIAVRQPVEVLASDDQNTAVTGGVNSGDFVITTTDRPVEPGDQVRMAD